MTSQLKDYIAKLEDTKTRLLNHNGDLDLKIKAQEFDMEKHIVGLNKELAEEKKQIEEW